MKKDVNSLKFPLKGKYVAMLAPSFIVDFSYPKITSQLKGLGFDKVVELTFGAKMINRDYHKKLENSKELVISSVCPGVVETIKAKFPKYKRNLIAVDSPMIAMSKICRETYPNHKIVFISPCNFKKIEAQKSKYVDYVIDYKELNALLNNFKGGLNENKELLFDRFYNDYTKIYPLSGGLSETAHVKGILKKDETKIIDGMPDIEKFLSHPDKKIRFLDVTFCKGGCIGGPCIVSKSPLDSRKKRLLKYLDIAKREEIPEDRKGLIKQARGISFKTNL